jgi:hypothetical protein
MLGQPHVRIEQAHYALLHHPEDSHGAAVSKMLFKGTRLLPGRDVRVRQTGLGGKLLVQALAPLAP